MKKIFLIIFLSVFLFSCQKKSLDNSTDFQKIELTSVNENEFSKKAQKWHATNKRIFLFLGHSYNSPEIIEQINFTIEENFGFAENDGLIIQKIFPNDFKYSNKSFFTIFADELKHSNEDFLAIILLGAPENTHIALSRYQDFWEQEIPFPIISLFPQDETLGIESTCDIVIDKSQAVEITGEQISEENEESIVEDYCEILINCINYVKNIDFPLQKDFSLKQHTIQMLKTKKIKNFIDPETGLQSINHFIIEN